MVLLRLASTYSSALVLAPLPTKALSAAFIAFTGDALAQHSESVVTQYEWPRGLSFAVFGAGYTGAFQHHLFKQLHASCHGDMLASCLNTFECTTPNANWLAAAEATLINQLFVVPLLYMPLFYLVNGLARGRSLRAIVAHASRKYLDVLVVNYIFWLPVQCAMFALLVPELLVPVTCIAGIVWNFILSRLTSLTARGDTRLLCGHGTNQ
mmetsp:Transcript_76475/g.127430  ORF Transcript_76475/g.127430 Transcript_76475/m.127430 type:complete len:210 (+) Transcript_76475:109-738(+)